MKFLKTACLSVALGLLASNFYAQEKTDGPLKLAIKAKNSNISKGGLVTDNFNVTGDLRFSTKDDAFTIGVFSGSSIARDYREFNYYASFSKNGFKLGIDDIYNPEKNSAVYQKYNAFNYNAKETGHFIDLSLEYQFAGPYPVKLHWNTVVFGNDRDKINKKGTEGNRYSSYISAYYPIVQGKKVNLTAGIGGAFALRSTKKIKKNLYGETAGIVNVELTASRVVEIFDHKLPISVSGIWNPQAQKTYMQIEFDLIRF